jgi:hypothetical protein
MLVVVWVALGVGVLASAGGLVRAARAGWRGWKTFRRTSGRIVAGLDAVASAGTAAIEHAAASAERTAAIGEATARLERSLAELAVLRRAAVRVNAGVGVARGLVPRK